MTAKQFTYTKKQWRKIEKYLCPDTEDTSLRCRLFDRGPWRDQILDVITDNLRAKEASQEALRGEHRKRHIQSGITAVRGLLRWIDRGRRLDDASMGETSAIRNCRETTQALLDHLSNELEELQMSNELEGLQKGPGRPCKDPALKTLLGGLVDIFDFFNWQSPLRTGGVSVIENRRCSSYLEACVRPLEKKYPDFPHFTATNLRQMTHRLRKFENEQSRKTIESVLVDQA
jgi:hypothetical protein